MPQFKIDPTKGKGGSIVITDESGNVASVLVTEEAAANQSRALLKPMVEGLIYPGSVGLIAAPPKAGKTNLGFMLAHELAGGRDYLGYSVKKECCVMIAEFEEADVVLAARYQRFPDDKEFYEDGELTVQYTPAPFMFAQDVAGAVHVRDDAGLGLQIKLWYDFVLKDRFKGRPGVVFIDTLVRALPSMGGGKYSAELNYIGAVHEFAAKFGIAIVFVHHTNKGDHADAADAISGTNGVAGSCDWMMVVFRDNDAETKKRLPTGRLVCNSRFTSEDELFRWVKLSDHGFWELDIEKEDAMALKARTQRDKAVPKCVKKVCTLMRHHAKWSGTASELIAAIKDDVHPKAVTKYLNKHQDWLAEQGIRYWNDRITAKRIIHFEVVAAPTEQAEIIDEDTPAGDVPPVETPSSEATATPVAPSGDPLPPLPEGYDPAERTVVMNITARVGEAEADEYIEAIHTLRDSCAGPDAQFTAKMTIGRVHTALGEAGGEVPTPADAIAGRWPESLVGVTKKPRQ